MGAIYHRFYELIKNSADTVNRETFFLLLFSIQTFTAGTTVQTIYHFVMYKNVYEFKAVRDTSRTLSWIIRRRWTVEIFQLKLNARGFSFKYID